MLLLYRILRLRYSVLLPYSIPGMAEVHDMLLLSRILLIRLLYRNTLPGTVGYATALHYTTAVEYTTTMLLHGMLLPPRVQYATVVQYTTAVEYTTTILLYGMLLPHRARYTTAHSHPF